MDQPVRMPQLAAQPDRHVVGLAMPVAALPLDGPGKGEPAAAIRRLDDLGDEPPGRPER